MYIHRQMVCRTVLSVLAVAAVAIGSSFAQKITDGSYRIVSSNGGHLSPGEYDNLAHVLPKQNNNSQIWNITFTNNLYLIQNLASGLYPFADTPRHVVILDQQKYLWNITAIDTNGGITIHPVPEEGRETEYMSVFTSGNTTVFLESFLPPDMEMTWNWRLERADPIPPKGFFRISRPSSNNSLSVSGTQQGATAMILPRQETGAQRDLQFWNFTRADYGFEISNFASGLFLGPNQAMDGAILGTMIHEWNVTWSDATNAVIRDFNSGLFLIQVEGDQKAILSDFPTPDNHFWIVEGYHHE
ncbi:hypothetical protein B0O80DRAFT_432900 [Mortierella sp. GBAus27b]|nr:hypothetical protein BGX31_006277 [Mortierella sp. GBA43]KAI8363171.1 hypothetical protein B0O80DRAFT_432900 [Mortierella sp. GBAus27b]